MTDTAASAERGECLNCRQAASGCWCGQLRPRPSRAQLVLLQHPREARNPVGTARMAHLSVTGSRLLVGVEFGTDPAFQAALQQAGPNAAVLFPTPDARDATELAQRPDPLTVFVLDGTWWQAQKLWRANPALHALPAYRLEPTQPSRYQIRSEPAPHCLSTIEAVSMLLDCIDGAPGRHADMLEPFLALVGRQQAYAQAPERSPRRRLRTARFQPSRLPDALRGFERLVVFHAEGNGWPARLDPRPPTELAQCVASRPATGEHFCAFVRPAAGLSPTTPGNLEVEPGLVLDGLEPAEFAQRWAAFLRPGDVLCGWGHFASRLIAATGAVMPAHVDLHAVCNERLRSRAGGIEDGHRRLAAPEIASALPGRAGRRLAMLEAVLAALDAP